MASTKLSPTDLKTLIKCAICDAPVEEAFAEEVYYDDTIRYKVKCHGDVDNCVLPRTFFFEYTINDIVEIVAFRTKRIGTDIKEACGAGSLPALHAGQKPQGVV